MTTDILTSCFQQSFANLSAQHWQQRTRFLSDAIPSNGQVSLPAAMSWTGQAETLHIASAEQQAAVVDLFRRKTRDVVRTAQQTESLEQLEASARLGFPAPPATPMLRPNTPHFENTLVHVMTLSKQRQSAQESPDIDAQIAAL